MCRGRGDVLCVNVKYFVLFRGFSRSRSTPIDKIMTVSSGGDHRMDSRLCAQADPPSVRAVEGRAGANSSLPTETGTLQRLSML